MHPHIYRRPEATFKPLLCVGARCHCTQRGKIEDFSKYNLPQSFQFPLVGRLCGETSGKASRYHDTVEPRSHFPPLVWPSCRLAPTCSVECKTQLNFLKTVCMLIGTLGDPISPLLAVVPSNNDTSRTKPPTKTSTLRRGTRLHPATCVYLADATGWNSPLEILSGLAIATCGGLCVSLKLIPFSAVAVTVLFTAGVHHIAALPAEV